MGNLDSPSLLNTQPYVEIAHLGYGGGLLSFHLKVNLSTREKKDSNSPLDWGQLGEPQITTIGPRPYFKEFFINCTPLDSAFRNI